VPDPELFTRVGFYRDDIAALSLRGDPVLATNSLIELIKFRPKLIVGYFYSKALLAAFVGRLLGARVLLTGGADQISPVLSSGRRLAVRQAAALLCLLFAHRILLSCKEDVVNFERLCLGLAPLKRKLRLASHVVTPAPFSDKPQVRRANGFDAFTLCWMGAPQNVRRKGVDKAVELIALLRAADVDARLDVAGADGPGRSLIELLAAKLGVPDHVRYVGAISEEEKRMRFSTGDVYLQISEHEGFGVAAAEAFFSGMTVVHSNRGGLSDVIGAHGLIVQPAEIGRGDAAWAREFYARFLRFKPDVAFLQENLKHYSIDARSKALLADDA